MKVVVPLAGKSTRYGLSRPKWLLTMPNGNLMVKECLTGVDMTHVDEIILIPLKSHLDQFIQEDFLSNEIEQMTSVKTTVIPLEESTACQAETVSKALSLVGGDFPIFIKDCDNKFIVKPQDKNRVCYLDLNNIEFVNARNKSYISFDALKQINRIVEKRVVSSYFCVGGYSFESSTEFIKSYKRVQSSKNLEVYISNVIYEMITGGNIFFASEVYEYEDWGTVKEYREKQSNYQTIFCDFDGVLVFNSSSFDSPPWQYNPIHENINSMLDLVSSTNVYLVITTSRPDSEKSRIIQFCQDNGLNVHQVVTGLPHCRRLLINDHSNTNSYPSAIGISVPRNLKNLGSFLNM